MVGVGYGNGLSNEWTSFSEARFAFAANRINLLHLWHQPYIRFILLLKGILYFDAMTLEKLCTLTRHYDHVKRRLEKDKFIRQSFLLPLISVIAG